MRVLVVNNRFPPYVTGGYEMSAYLATQALRSRGHDVRVLVSSYGVDAPPEVNDWVTRRLHRVEQSPRPLSLLLYAWEDVRLLRRLLHDFKPHLVSAWNLNSLFPEVLRTLMIDSPHPTVFHLHDLWLDWTSRWATDWNQFWGRASSTWWRRAPKRVVGGFLQRFGGVADGWPDRPSAVRMQHAVYCSDYQRVRHAEAGIHPSDYRVILSGTDVDLFSPAPSGVGSETLRLLFVGRIVEEKGILELVQAMLALEGQGLERLELTVAGVVPPDRRCYEATMHLAEAPPLRGRIRFVGLVTPESMPDLYRRHDVLVLPTAHREGLPRAVMEAMACGLAVIAAPTGGTAEILRPNDNALVVPARDRQALSASLHRVLNDPDLRARLGARARLHVLRHHSIATTMDAIVAYYEDVIAGPAARAAEERIR